MPAQPPSNSILRPGRLVGVWRGRRPSSRAWAWVALAFLGGLLLFLALWWRDRGNDFYRAQALPQAEPGQQFEPLPAPLPAGESPDNASGLGTTPDQAPPTGQQPHIVQPPAAARAPQSQAPASAAPTPVFTAPVPIQAPAPAYPAEAFRNGESGTVLLRVHVDPQGVPYAIDLVQSSRSRALDRAASQAVKHWRFQPAQRGGQAVAGEVQVPIAFNADR